MKKPIQPAMPRDAPITHPRLDTGPQPGANPFQETSVLSPSPRLEPAGLLSAGSWDVASFPFEKKRVCPCGGQHGHDTWQGGRRTDGSLLWSLVQAQPREALAGR